MAAIPQYSDEQRNFLNNAYIKSKGRKGFFRVICDEFEAAFPGVRRPQASTIRRITLGGRTPGSAQKVFGGGGGGGLLDFKVYGAVLLYRYTILAF